MIDVLYQLCLLFYISFNVDSTIGKIVYTKKFLTNDFKIVTDWYNILDDNVQQYKYIPYIN